MAGTQRTKTDWKGIYRRGERYMYVWRDAHGRQRNGSARTLQEAKEAKARRELEARTGGAVDDRRVLFAEFARDWVTSYQGKGRSGFRENTRAEYRRDLERYAIAFLGPRQRVAEITPRHMARLVAWLCDDAAQRRRHAEETARRVRDGERPAPSPCLPLSDQTVRRIVAPLRACLGGAVREGLIASNPCASLALPHRPRIDDDDEAEVKALTRAQLHAFLAIVNPRYRTVFEVLATTGLRISELLPLQWRHLHLDGDRPSLRVRRASVRGVLGPPKSKYGRSELPLPLELAADLRARRLATAAGDQDLVFAGRTGAMLDRSNLRRDALTPAATAIGAGWMGFHTLRHTCASLLFDEGRNAVQVQRWLGHHSPAFTLATYVHLLSDDLGAPLALPGRSAPAEPAGAGGSILAARATDAGGDGLPARNPETAS